jgi:hypothetical protein
MYLEPPVPSCEAPLTFLMTVSRPASYSSYSASITIITKNHLLHCSCNNTFTKSPIVHLPVEEMFHRSLHTSSDRLTAPEKNPFLSTMP